MVIIVILSCFGFSNKKKFILSAKFFCKPDQKKKKHFPNKKIEIRNCHYPPDTYGLENNNKWPKQKKKESLKVKNEPENKFGKTKPLQTISRPYLYLYLCLSVFFSCWPSVYKMTPPSLESNHIWWGNGGG